MAGAVMNHPAARLPFWPNSDKTRRSGGVRPKVMLVYLLNERNQLG